MPPRAPRFEVFHDGPDGLWYWRLVNNGRIVADSGEGYSTESNARRSIATLKRWAIAGKLQAARVIVGDVIFGR